MEVSELIKIAQTRMDCEDKRNPTSRSFFYEIVKALEKLKKYEDKEKKDGEE